MDTLITFKLSVVINVSVIVEFPTSNAVELVVEFPIVSELEITNALTVIDVALMLVELINVLAIVLPILIEDVVRFKFAPTFIATEAFTVPVIVAPEDPVIRPEALIVFA